MRWRCLSKRMNCKIGNVVNTVAACITLHNFYEIMGDHFLDEWRTLENKAHCNQTHFHHTSIPSAEISVML